MQLRRRQAKASSALEKREIEKRRHHSREPQQTWALLSSTVPQPLNFRKNDSEITSETERIPPVPPCLKPAQTTERCEGGGTHIPAPGKGGVGGEEDGVQGCRDAAVAGAATNEPEDIPVTSTSTPSLPWLQV
ncbi:hypothetical protein EYF80_014608 [Liparis tanakae]|uniref:Uncharacterized protein n=1 Tax=Liparis tanakae TaxID=230148 RepID=A0A4Z2IB06_9TELE|nr:hypothetical protein EYF80_014608 [Liparis tanakae]